MAAGDRLSSVSTIAETGVPVSSVSGITTEDLAPLPITPTGPSRDPTVVEYTITASPIGGLTFPADIGKYKLQLSFFKYQRPSVFDSLDLSQSEFDIFLPMPGDTIDSTYVDWKNSSMPGAAGYIMEQGMRMINNGNTDAADVLASGAGGLIAGAIHAGTESGALGRIAASVLSRGRAGAGASRVLGNIASNPNTPNLVGNILQAMGLAENPFMTYQLTGPRFKTHRFTWKLMPRTPQESTIVANIVKEIKKRGLPSITSWGGAYGYPHIVHPKYHPETEFMYIFKPCVLTDFSFDYTPEPVPSFFAGTSAPAAVVISISLTEIELWVSNDFDGTSRDGTPDQEIASIARSFGLIGGE